MGTFLSKQPITLTKYDKHLVRRQIEVTFYEDKFTTELETGVTVISMNSEHLRETEH